MILNRAEILKDAFLTELPFFGPNGYIIKDAVQRCEIVITDTIDNWFYIDFEEGDGAILFEPDENVSGKSNLRTQISYKLIARVSGLNKIPVLEAMIAVMRKYHITPESARIDSENIFQEEYSGDKDLQCNLDLIKINFTDVKVFNYNQNCINQICEGC